MKKNLVTIAFFCFYATIINAQNLLNQPEHVVYDEVNNQYLVTNYGSGEIVAITEAGEQQVIIDGITGCLGIHIIDTTIYITAWNQLFMYGLMFHEPVHTITLDVESWVDGMIEDNEGNLYLVENAGKIHKVRLSDYSDTIIISSGLPYHPQDITFDPEGNRLILVGWQFNGSITEIDLDTYEVSNLVQTTSGQYDGIVRNSNGDLYYTSWLNNGRIYQIEYPYTNNPVIYYEGLEGPAGLAINLNENVLAVPNFNGDSISYITLPQTTSIINNNQNSPFLISDNILTINDNEPAEIIISDITGKVVFREREAGPEGYFDLDKILLKNKTGIYIISIRMKQEIFTVKYFLN